jgi:hypothetical protein
VDLAITNGIKVIHTAVASQHDTDYLDSGKISSLSLTPETSEKNSVQSATVTFEQETAAKTALLLDNTQLGSSQINVTGAQSLSDLSGSRNSDGKDDELSQEDKPRSRIAAEMLAHGYAIGDTAIKRALALDQQHGISTRFQNALTQFDQRFKATETAQGLDQKYNITQRATEGWKSLYSYFDKAAETPTGQKLRAFYEQGQKQVLDVHNEARHLAELKKNKDGQSTSETISEQASQTAEKAKGAANSAYNSASEQASSAVDTASKQANSAANTVSEKANSAANTASEQATQATEKAKDAVSGSK